MSFSIQSHGVKVSSEWQFYTQKVLITPTFKTEGLHHHFGTALGWKESKLASVGLFTKADHDHVHSVQPVCSASHCSSFTGAGLRALLKGTLVMV